MAAYNFVWKAFGTDNVWNLPSAEDSDSLTLTVGQADKNLITLTAQSQGNRLYGEIRGHFEFTAPLTIDSFSDVTGTIDSLYVWLNDLPQSERIFPAGTSVQAWNLGNGGYAFDTSLLNGNDYFAGSPMRHDNYDNDGIRGGDGNDTFIGYGSTQYDDEFYGEAGIDTAIYRGKFSEYTIVWSESIWDGRLQDGTTTSGYIVTDSVTARDDTDRLVGVERLQFSDVTLALDIDGIAAEAYRIYKAAFDRQPDLTGLGFWIKNMDAGMGLEAVAQEFITSAEFIRMYGANPTDEQFVDLLYANVLDRQADQSGYDFWIGALDRGLTRAGLLAEFSESRENVANVAPLIEDGIQYTVFVG
ncbi:DUF4214 domain-containing protein [Orrella daihaiensis]|uniref:DUF4214 domain-containing protein n=1 Tax=Orrella daihaiensis TaxID=2782176 RepID=A0ABY4ALW4_9BURK|nr:DUF4214 domain-containing protein [Orrella daihaiensis]UOD50405.1 DUF4214 domain-containing protein [Orrella daihaiensis]